MRIGLVSQEYPPETAHGGIGTQTYLKAHGLAALGHAVYRPALDSECWPAGTIREVTCLRLADDLYASSGCSADWCSKHYGIGREEMPVLQTGVDTRLFRPCPVQKENRPTIVFVGRI